jgi:hypothetical protein
MQRKRHRVSYTACMRLIALAGMVAVGAGVLMAQEKPVPKDSELVSIQGCARGRTFIVGQRSEDQPGTLSIAPGRRFRLNGTKKILDDIKARERTIVEVTGLVRKSDVNPPQGIPVLGGRVRIGGGMPRDPISDPARDPAYNQAVIDVQSWRVLTGDCEDR